MTTKISKNEAQLHDKILALNHQYDDILKAQQDIFKTFKEYNNPDFDEAIFATAFDRFNEANFIVQQASNAFDAYLKDR